MNEQIFRHRTIAILLVLAFAVFEAAMARHVVFGPGWDEWEHFSLIQHLRQTSEALPDHRDLRKLAPDGTWSGAVNHLAHPPAYHLLAALVPSEAGDPATWPRVRAVSLVLVVGALAAFALFAVPRFACRRARLVAVTVPLAFAPLSVAGMIVTNDSLAFACGVAVCIGMVRWAEDPSRRGGLALAAVALAVAGWTKLIAAMLLFLFAGVVVLAAPGLAAGQRLAALATLAPAAVAAAVPYAVNVLRFGQPVFPGHIHIGFHHEMAAVGFWSWTKAFLGEMVFTAVSFQKFPLDPVRVASALAMVAGAPLAALALVRRRGVAPVALGVAAALAVTLAIHLHYTHQVNLAVGLNPHHAGGHARLYLAILPAVALLAGHLFETKAPPARWAAAALVAVLILGSMPATFVRIALGIL